MGDDDDFSPGICGYDGLGPSECDVPGIKLKNEKKILGTVDREDAVEVFVAARRVLALVPTIVLVAGRTKEGVEVGGLGCAPAGITTIGIIVIADGQEVRNLGIIE